MISFYKMNNVMHFFTQSYTQAEFAQRLACVYYKLMVVLYVKMSVPLTSVLPCFSLIPASMAK